MTNPEQTLRERLAEALYGTKPWTSVPDTPQAHVMTWAEAKEYDCGGYASEIYAEADATLSVIREWLESEAVKVGNECEQDRKSITGGIMASPYLRGKYSAIKDLTNSLGDTP